MPPYMILPGSAALTVIAALAATTFMLSVAPADAQQAASGSLAQAAPPSSTSEAVAAGIADPSLDPNAPAGTVLPAVTLNSEVQPERRAMPAPIDPVFPFQEWLGSDGQLPIGVPDSGPVYPIEKYLWKHCPLIRKAKIRIYGWADAGYGYSSSRHSNFPMTYYIVPNKPQLDQLCLRVERVPDTVQTKHLDWGFRSTQLYGIDYRFTTSQGWGPASQQLLSRNYLYGYDSTVELYGLLYVPKVAQGMMIKFGRYISPPDIEAQLAPDNFLWTHSQMFYGDCYTQTGVLTSIKLNKQWTVQAGIHAGTDMAPWAKGAKPSFVGMLRWISKSNNDSIYGGVDAVNNGQFSLSHSVQSAAATTAALNLLGSQVTPAVTFPQIKVPAHDNLQQFNLTWQHRFNRKGTIITLTEGYVLYNFDALLGGTVINGPPRTYFAGTGPGRFLPGTSMSWGIVNYLAFKLSKKDFITLRPVDFLGDPRGARTGFPTTYSTWTAGWTHRFNDLLCIRPEIRYERALNSHGGAPVTPYDNGTRRSQFTFGLDVIQRF
jgi:hypothetical protein